MRVLVIDDLFATSETFEVAPEGALMSKRNSRERMIAELALEIYQNMTAGQEPRTRVAHLSEIAGAAQDFRPHAIVLSGTLQDFDFYHPQMIENFTSFIRRTRTPVLGICGGHELVGLSFGARVVTLSNMEQHEQRQGRSFEYQYRFIRISDPLDPIFCGINDPESGTWQDYTKEARILRVWQNHGRQVDRVPECFKLLASPTCAATR